MKLADDVCSILSRWRATTQFDEAFLFGSLVYKDGELFDANESDVDVIVSFPGQCSALERWRIVCTARPTIQALNADLLNLLGRSDGSRLITSIVPVTRAELAAGIHKDGGAARDFFSANLFRNVVTGGVDGIGRVRTPTTTLIEGAFDGIRGAQKFRNEFLAIRANGNCPLSDYDGPRPLPKALRRAAAQVRCAREKSASSTERWDVNEGLMFMWQVLAARRQEAEELNTLFSRCLRRGGGVGAVEPLTPTDQLLLWELLADEAASFLPSSSDEKVVGDVRPHIYRLPLVQVQPSDAARRATIATFRDRCCFPNCGVPLGGIGELAMIRSPTPGGPRFDPSVATLSPFDESNLILLCPTHHRFIDLRPADFPVEVLLAWRKRAAARAAAERILQLTVEHLLAALRGLM